MKKLNITPGKVVRADGDKPWVNNDSGFCIADFGWDEDMGEFINAEAIANATLYADAHNTYHATQMLPSQMAERIKALEDGLRGIANVTEAPSQTNTSHMERCDWVARRARALLSPAINEAHGHLLTNPE
jgi:hypothetical protein